MELTGKIIALMEAKNGISQRTENPCMTQEHVNLSTEVTDEDLANARTDEFGVVYSKDRKRLLCCERKHFPSKKYCVKVGTIVICDWAFSGCSSLSEIHIPDSVTKIGGGAFNGCKSLSQIVIPTRSRSKFEEMLPEFWECLTEDINATSLEELYLFFDTETTGVPRNYKAPSSNIQNWPRLVQLAWILTDDKGNRIHSSNLIVRPDGFAIPTDAAKVHGITTELAMAEGIPLGEAINLFIEYLNTARYIVGHNIDFDKKIIGAEMIRLGMKDIMKSKKSYCTMQSSIDFCKIPGKYGFKYPKLQELYKKLFGTEFDNAHDAMNDIRATEKCFWELRKRKLI